MLFHVEPDSPVPIYEQIVVQVTFAVASELLKPGSLIPSVRDLAVTLTVHPNTVAKAFQELERRKILVAIRGKGMSVTEEGPELCRTHRLQIVGDRIRAALREASASGLARAEVLRLVENELVEVERPRPVSTSHFQGKR